MKITISESSSEVSFLARQTAEDRIDIRIPLYWFRHFSNYLFCQVFATSENSTNIVLLSHWLSLILMSVPMLVMKLHLCNFCEANYAPVLKVFDLVLRIDTRIESLCFFYSFRVGVCRWSFFCVVFCAFGSFLSHVSVLLG